MEFVIGVDGGASKTLCLAARRDGQVMGLGRAGPSNHQACGLGRAMIEVAQAVKEATEPAAIPAGDIALGMFCLAGADLPDDYAMLQQALEQASLCRRVVVKNDTMAALRSGLSRPWGVVVICGTGTNAAGRAPDGREIIMPGLGFISGDWGGGAQICQEVIRRVMRAHDGRGKPTVLLQMVLDHLQAPTPEELIDMLYKGRIEYTELLGLVPLLFEAASAGDEVACELVEEVGREVGVTAGALIRRLSLQRQDVEVVLAGSVFKGRGPLLVDTVRQVVHRVAPEARIVLPRYEPVVGALFLALEAAGTQIDERVLRNIEASIPAELLMGSRSDRET